jgi:hypothetical protein
MPRIGVYVSEADKAFLDALPAGATGAALLRGAIGVARRHGQDCPHDRIDIRCRRCGAELDTYPVYMAPSGDEEPGEPGADPVCI